MDPLKLVDLLDRVMASRNIEVAWHWLLAKDSNLQSVLQGCGGGVCELKECWQPWILQQWVRSSTVNVLVKPPAAAGNSSLNCRSNEFVSSDGVFVDSSLKEDGGDGCRNVRCKDVRPKRVRSRLRQGRTNSSFDDLLLILRIFKHLPEESCVVKTSANVRYCISRGSIPLYSTLDPKQPMNFLPSELRCPVCRKVDSSGGTTLRLTDTSYRTNQAWSMHDTTMAYEPIHDTSIDSYLNRHSPSLYEQGMYDNEHLQNPCEGFNFRITPPSVDILGEREENTEFCKYAIAIHCTSCKKFAIASPVIPCGYFLGNDKKFSLDAWDALRRRMPGVRAASSGMLYREYADVVKFGVCFLRSRCSKVDCMNPVNRNGSKCPQCHANVCFKCARMENNVIVEFMKQRLAIRTRRISNTASSANIDDLLIEIEHELNAMEFETITLEGKGSPRDISLSSDEISRIMHSRIKFLRNAAAWNVRHRSLRMVGVSDRDRSVDERVRSRRRTAFRGADVRARIDDEFLRWLHQELGSNSEITSNIPRSLFQFSHDENIKIPEHFISFVGFNHHAIRNVLYPRLHTTTINGGNELNMNDNDNDNNEPPNSIPILNLTPCKCGFVPSPESILWRNHHKDTCSSEDNGNNVELDTSVNYRSSSDNDYSSNLFSFPSREERDRMFYCDVSADNDDGEGEDPMVCRHFLRNGCVPVDCKCRSCNIVRLRSVYERIRSSPEEINNHRIMKLWDRLVQVYPEISLLYPNFGSVTS